MVRAEGLVHLSRSRNLSKFQGGLQAALCYADMMINACAGHPRFPLNSHLCKQQETWPAGPDPAGAEPLWQVCADVRGTMQESGPDCCNNDVSKPLESLLRKEQNPEPQRRLSFVDTGIFS